MIKKETNRIRDTFYDSIKDKAVCIAGPADVSDENTEVINSSDFVIRFNNVIEYIDSENKLKLDILYISPGHLRMYLDEPEQLINVIKLCNIKFIICCNNHPDHEEVNLAMLKELDILVEEHKIVLKSRVVPGAIVRIL